MLTTGLEIAIIGMSVRMPKANTLDEFWDNLKTGKNCITFFTDDELREAGYSEDIINDPNYVKAKGIIDQAMGFDPEVFGYSNREAQLMDPQLRVYHECAYQALIDAGYTSDNVDGQIGMYGGVGDNVLWRTQFFNSSESLAGNFQAANLNGAEFYNTRVANKLNLKGPAITIQTACSSSLVALHMAAQGLIAGDCDVALAGGVEMNTDPYLKQPEVNGYLYQEGMVNSPDGYCRPFDKDAAGTFLSDGCGMVVLKRLEDAIADGDKIYAVVKGSAINNDGKEKIGYTAPSVQGQSSVIQAALEMAEVETDSIRYIEAHGTGTKLGDPIEIEALSTAFDTEQTNFCAIGSVKSNIGHLGAAAGIAGLIKTALAIHHKQLPPSLNFVSPNPEINFAKSPFFVATQLQNIEDAEHPFRAGVSSFGIGGTNAHVILEEYRNTDKNQSSEGYKNKVLVFSATNEKSLNLQSDNLARYLKKNPDINLSDVEFNLQLGRPHLDKRLAVVGENFEQIVQGLENDKSINRLRGKVKNNFLIFMFPGQGSQYNRMAVELYDHNPIFRDLIEDCFNLMPLSFAAKLRLILFSATGDNGSINETQYTQPLLFIIEYALAQYLIKVGIQPKAMIGHSLGELVAATISGVFELKEAIELVILRGNLMAKTAEGGMVAVVLDEMKLKDILPEDLSIAAINTSNAHVISGEEKAINEFIVVCEHKNIMHKKLVTNKGYHSSLMDPILNDFVAAFSDKKLKAPKIPFISNVTGSWITVEQATSADYWAQHLRQAVQFFSGVNHILQQPADDFVFVEIGSGTTLSSFIKQNRGSTKQSMNVNLLPHAKESMTDTESVSRVLAKLHISGVKVNWSEYHKREVRGKVDIPGYVFDRTNFTPNLKSSNKPNSLASAQDSDQNIKYYTPHWERGNTGKNNLSSLISNSEITGNWLIFKDDKVGGVLAEFIRGQGCRVITVSVGEKYGRIEGDDYGLQPGNESDYTSLFHELVRLQAIPDKILNLWPLDKIQANDNVSEQVNLDRCFYSFVNLAKQIGEFGIKKVIRLLAVSSDLHSVTGEESICPVKSTLLGAVRVIGQEYANIECQNIDFGYSHLLKNNPERLIEPILAELFQEEYEQLVAIRGPYRWLREFKKANFKTDKNDNKLIRSYLKNSGHYLITGGLGSLALALAQDIAKNVNAQFTLISRTGLPHRDDWSQWLSSHSDEDPVSQKIKSVQNIELSGSKVLIFKADITVLDQTVFAIKESQKINGAIKGVIHAAGLPSGGAIQNKSKEDLYKIIEPKVFGTQCLAEALEYSNSNPNFVCLFSSVTSLVGGFGQVDYCAANSYLDACVHSRLFDNAGHVSVINWDAWKEIGMAAEYAQSTNHNKQKVVHPLLGSVANKTETSISFTSRLSAQTCWMLNEHVIFSEQTMPGTAYLEMARSAFNYLTDIDQIEFSEVYFLAPLNTIENQEIDIKTQLVKNGNNFDFVISSVVGNGLDEIQHAKGQITAAVSLNSPIKSVEELIYKCSDKMINCTEERLDFLGGEKGEREFYYGPHWDSFQKVYLGQGRCVFHLRLKDEFASELSELKLHPSILDCATSSAFDSEDDKFYIPLHYKKIIYYRPLTQVCYSSIVPVSNNYGVQEVDISIYDAKDNLLLDIIGFSKREIAESDFVNSPKTEKAIIKLPIKNELPLLNKGLETEEGIVAFHNIISQKIDSVVITKSNINSEIASHRNFKSFKDIEGLTDSVSLRERPELSNAYVGPKTDVEKKLVGLWQQMLSINNIGINDDFFELGGDSLVLMQIHSELSGLLSQNIAIAELYNYPTIEGLANSLKKGDPKNNQQLNQAEKRAMKIKSALKKRRRTSSLR